MQAILNGLLEEESVCKAADPATNPTQTMLKLRSLVLRNKADILCQSDDTAAESLQLYEQALRMDGNDASLLNKMGSLVSPSSTQLFAFKTY